MKATHVGHCQICGSSQKLPGGVLSKHGYTTRFHFFEGVCVAAHYLPFEQDISLIRGIIDATRQRAKGVREQAAREREDRADPDRVWYHAYLVNSRGRGAYQWVQTRLQIEDRVMRYEKPADGRNREPQWERVHGGLPYELQAAAQEYNADHAKTLDKLAASLDEYISWQENRIKDWTPQPLTPVR